MSRGQVQTQDCYLSEISLLLFLPLVFPGTVLQKMQHPQLATLPQAGRQLEIRNSGPTLDILNQNQHFKKNKQTKNKQVIQMNNKV